MKKMIEDRHNHSLAVYWIRRICLGMSLGIMTLNVVPAQSIGGEVQNQLFWKIREPHAIVWDLQNEEKLPHQDNIEMSGQKVSAIVHYQVDENRNLTVRRDVIFPQLRRHIKTTDPEWMQYRAYLRTVYEDEEVLPVITVKNRIVAPGAIDSIVINGRLNFYHAPQQGLRIVRTLLPSMTDRLFVEKWIISNRSDSITDLSIGSKEFTQQEMGIYGLYKQRVHSDAGANITIAPGDQYEFAIYYSAALDEIPNYSFAEAEQKRDAFVQTMQNNLILGSPDSLLNTLFYFSKIRAAESIFDTKMGLVHSPGGGRYYTGVWANDQAEYSGPFFPYLGYEVGNEAAMNAYRMFLKNIPAEGEKMWSSFEMQGELTCCSNDRGDAAMIAYGATNFVLASGSREYAKELWPLIEWALEYCERKRNKDGVVASDSDELEERFPSGDANLATSSLYYGALLHAADLAKALNKPPKLVKSYEKRVNQMAQSIEDYFGATISGLDTYKYYEENTTLRSWICLPLVMGIEKRKEGTLDALFSKLWRPNGVLIEEEKDSEGTQTFWDRGTLYAFRGAFEAGAADQALEKLKSFSKTRLIGYHVPYVVEAWPEGDMAHLSAESALYCRIFTEGVLGISPTGFNSFTLKPNLPTAWPYLHLKNIYAFDSVFDISVTREGDTLQVSVRRGGENVFSKQVRNGEVVQVTL